MFPASASMGLAMASTSAVLAALAILSAFSGIITDPIQARFGIHEKRLNRLLDSLEKTLMDKKNSDLKIRELYLARVFDLLDLLKTAAHAII
jgi:flavin-dependent dehydrogenase